MNKDLEAYRLSLANKGLNGLANISNSCYINTIIQCLGHCTRFLYFVLKDEYKIVNYKQRTPFLEEFKEILNALWINDTGLIPHRFLKVCHQYIQGIDIYEQNDAQEFLTMFIDKLNFSISQNINVPEMMDKTVYTDTNIDKLKKRLDIAWYNSICKEYSSLIDYFYGQTVIQIVCGNCKKIHHNYENFSVLLIPIPNEQNGLNDCIKHYLLEEYLDTWKCDSCSETSKSLRTMKFWRLPKILVVSLKRFNYDMTKNNTPVAITSNIDLKEYILSPNTPSKYTLRSIACHSGSFSNGHYWAICQNPNGKWYRIDDTMISEFDASSEFAGGVYLLFYELL